MKEKYIRIEDIVDDHVYYMKDIKKIFKQYNLPHTNVTLYKMMKDGRINNVSTGGLQQRKKKNFREALKICN